MADIRIKDLNESTEFRDDAYAAISSPSETEEKKISKSTLASELAEEGKYATQTAWQEPSGGYIMDGSNDYITTPPLNINSNNLSIEAWIRPRGTSTYQQIFYADNGSAFVEMRIINGADLRFKINDGVNYVEVRKFGAITSGKTYHAVGVNDGSKMSLYLNGEFLLETNSSSLTNFTLVSDTIIGEVANTYYFDGDICAVRPHNFALPSDVIKKLYNNGIPSNTPYELQGANNTPIYQSDFSAGVDGWTEGEVTLTGNTDGISDGTTSKDDVLQVACSTNNAYHYAQKNLPFAQSKYVKLEFDYYIPSTADNITRIVVGNAITDGDVIEGSRYATTKGSWAHHSFVLKLDISSPRNFRFWGSNDAFTTFAGTANDIYYLKNVKTTAVGAVLDLKPANAGSNGWVDASGNGLHGHVEGGAVRKQVPAKIDYRKIETTSYAFTDSCEAGQTLHKIKVVNNDNVNDVIVSFGTTASGTDIVNAQTVPAGETKNFVVDFPMSDGDVYFSSSSANVNIETFIQYDEV